jgi:hypothetical protein
MIVRAALLAVSIAMTGCRQESCFDQVENFRQYRVHLVREYRDGTPGYHRDLDSKAPSRCAGVDALGVNSSFVFATANRTETRICEEYDGDLRFETQPVPGITLTPMRPHATITQNLANVLVLAIQGGSRATTAAGCAGSWGFNIKYLVPAGDVFRTPGPSETPVLLFERWFAPVAEQPPSCLECSDTYVAHLQPI